MPETEIRLNPDGTVKAEWWTPEIATVICSICAKGGGWPEFGGITPDELLSSGESLGQCLNCPARNPWCG